MQMMWHFVPLCVAHHMHTLVSALAICVSHTSTNNFSSARTLVSNSFPASLPHFLPFHFTSLPFSLHLSLPNPPPAFFLSFPSSLPLSFPLLLAHSSPPPFHSLSLSRSLCHTHTLARSLAHTHTLFLSMFLFVCALPLSPSLSLALSRSLCLSHFVASSLVRSVSHVLSHSLCSLDPPHSSLGPLPSLSHR